MEGYADCVAGARELAYFELLRQRLQKTVPVAQPAAGAEWAAIVPAGVSWELLAVNYSFVTSAVVATRTGRLVFQTPDGLTSLILSAVLGQSAGSSVTYGYSTGFGATTASGIAQAGLPSPPLLLPSGSAIRSLSSNLDAADQYGSVMLTVREWQQSVVDQAADYLQRHAPR